jgi:hypothetical protein
MNRNNRMVMPILLYGKERNGQKKILQHCAGFFAK